MYGKKFTSQEAVQNAFIEFVDSRSLEFYRKSLNDLPIRWQKCINNEGKYFDKINTFLLRKKMIQFFRTKRQFHTLTPNISSFHSFVVSLCK